MFFDTSRCLPIGVFVMPKAGHSDQIGAAGVTLVQHAVESKLGWIFRRVEHRDTGLDAEVEVVFRGEATGLVLGLQIKSGPTYFAKRTERGWRYRGDFDHLIYWRDHNLPVVVVLVDVEEGTCYWAAIGDEVAIAGAGSSWTIEVFADDVVGAGCAQQWMDAAWARNPTDALYRYCGLHREYIALLANGGRLYLEVDDWANKTRGQAQFRLVLETAEGAETVREFGFFAGVRDPAEFAQAVFPWADVNVDEEFYEVHEDVPPDAVFQDADMPGGYLTIETSRAVGVVRPYVERAGGEVLSYRFELALNEVGESYAAFSCAAAAMETYSPHRVAKMIAGMVGWVERGQELDARLERTNEARRTVTGHHVHLGEEGARRVPTTPHSPEWFQALGVLAPQQAAMTANVLKLAGSSDVCSVCGDRPAVDYTVTGVFFPDGSPATLRLCRDCRRIREDRGEQYTELGGLA